MIRLRWSGLALGFLLVAACRPAATEQSTAVGAEPPAPPAPPPSPVPAPVPASIAVSSGDNQVGDPGDTLDVPVVFTVLDAQSHPVPGVAVQLTLPLGGGTVPLGTLKTDANGTVTTIWVMGTSGGQQTLEADITPALSATAHATTCDADDCYPPEVVSSTLAGASLLSLATYEGSGQSVHPDVVRGHGTSAGWWLAITPYPGGNSAYENPSIYHSSDAMSWNAPPAVTNPLVAPGSGYNSDPDIVLDTSHTLWLYYRSVIGQQNIISVIHSADGVTWDAPTQVIAVPNHQLVSPAVVRGAPDAPWQMWSVNSGPMGCTATNTTVERRTSNDGLSWSAPATVKLTQPGRAIWHIDVEWVPALAEYWAVYNTYAIGTSCTTDALYIARSSDGVNWKVYPSPIARAGVTDAFQSIVYRSTFVTDSRASRITLWISGAAYRGNAYVWQTATVTLHTADLFTIASTPSTALRADPSRAALPYPEPDLPTGP